jgi:sulfonate transport system permease protein
MAAGRRCGNASADPLPEASMTDAILTTDASLGRDTKRAVDRTRRRDARTVPLGWIVPFLLVAAWQVAATTGLLSSSILPNPLDVIKAAWRLTVSGELLGNIEVSAFRAFAGLVIGGGIGLAFAFANGLSRWSDGLTDTTLQMVRNVPHLALIPLVIVWFGIDEGAKLFLVGLGVFFPIYLNTLHGIRAVDPQLVEMGRSYGMTARTLFWRIILPGALPSIFVGLRFALGITWLTLIVAETIAAQSGIGYMAMQAREFMQLDVVVLAILIYAVLGKLADSSVRVLERTFLSWNPAYNKAGAR